MQITKIVVGVILAGAMGIVVASWRSDFSEPSRRRLVPPGAAGVAKAVQASAEKAQELSFDLLAQTVIHENPPPDFPKALLALAGKRVRITGFIAPYNDPQKMAELLLVQSPGGCYFCNPPEINAVVFVRRRPNDPPLNLDGQPMSFAGTLRLWRSDLKDADESRQFLFTLDDASHD
jgi:hypothetical protein